MLIELKAKKFCKVNGCNKKYHAKGLCQPHYNVSYWDSSAKFRPLNKEAAAKYHRSDKGLFKALKEGARKRGYEVAVSLERFSELRKMACFYCGGTLSEVGHSMDRRDNSAGYTEANTVACCAECNYTKSDKLSDKEMLLIIAFRNQESLCSLG